jgi:type IV fimbrial biogenesis protein FimT
MRQLSQPRQPGQAGQRGTTLVELMIGLAILALLAAIGIPSMATWISGNKAVSAGEFYADGFAMARRQAVLHNAASRIVLTPNVNNGQMDWQVDVCFPAPGVPCNDSSGTWSTTSTPAPSDPEGVNGYKSVLRPADALPQSDMLVPKLEPEGTSAVYFTSLGWVDTGYADRLGRIRLDPAGPHANEIAPVAVAVSLSGLAIKCNPVLAAPDSRACPP